MKNRDFSIGWYLFAFAGGLASGLMYSKSKYYEGQADAYDEIAKDLEGLTDRISKPIKDQEEEA